MKSKNMERLLRLLIVLLGIGIGIAIGFFLLQIYNMAQPNNPLNPGHVMIGQIALAVIGGIVFLVLSTRIMSGFRSVGHRIEKAFARMPLYQLLSSIIGLILGLIIAALLCQMLNFLGTGIFTAVLSAILYLTLGVLGFNLGRRRSREFTTMFLRFSGNRDRQKVLRHSNTTRKFLDTSAIIDGRALEVCKAGFVEGEIVVPDFVIDELRHLADSSDTETREKGRRGLNLLQAAQAELPRLTTDDTNYSDVTDVDVKLLRLAREQGGTVITGDYNLVKAAQVSSIKAMNINDLAGALRPAVAVGMEMNVRITREGKEAGQGVGYMSDGTMIVVENGRDYVGEEKDVTVTGSLQTSAGRMVFAKLKEQ